MINLIIITITSLILSIAFVAFVIWSFKRIIRRDVVELPKNGWLLVRPDDKPKYFTDDISAACYITACKEAKMVFDVFKIRNGDHFYLGKTDKLTPDSYE